MAKLVDADGTVIAEENEPTLVSFDELNEDTAETTTPEPVVEDVNEEEDALPEKYQGKSAADIAQMHQELERRMGQQSQEVGLLRKQFDEMVQAQLTQQAAQPEAEVNELDFLTSPAESVNTAINNHPAIKQAQEASAQLQHQARLAELTAKHPDIKDVLGSEEFKTWVGGTGYRSELLHRADTKYDFGAMDELLTQFKERAELITKTKAASKAGKKEEIKQASTGSARSANVGQQPKKTYRRADIINLMKTNPARYEALSGEILQAYAEGRVK